jgi:hypothetical protein
MATSIGGAISEGLESGLRLGLGLQDRQRQQQRQEEEDQFRRDDRALRAADRQLMLEDRARALERQKRADRAAALAGQSEEIRRGLSALKPGDTSPAARALVARSEALDKELGRLHVEGGGIDFDAKDRAAAEEAAADAKLLDEGRGWELNPLRRAKAIVAVGRRPATDFFRVDGQPSKVGSAIQGIRAGLAEGGDRSQIVRAVNVLEAPRLAKGVGQPSPHGGTIVGKEIDDLDMVPGSDPNDPTFVPRLKVWVRQDLKSDEDRRLVNRWRAANPGAPEGATGYYYAPATQGGGTGNGDMVSSFTMSKGMQYLSNLAQMEEWINDPAVAADLTEGLGQFDQNRLLAAMAARGLAPKLAKQTKLGPGDEIVSTDERGREVAPRIRSATPRTSPELEQARMGLIAAQTAAAAALAGLRNTRGNSAEERRQRQFEAKQALASLVAQRVAASGIVREYVNEIKDAGPTRRKELQPLLDQARADVSDLMRQIGELNKATAADSAPGGAGLGAAPAAGKALPMPKTKADLKKGEIYETSRGPAKWNGTAFEQ